VLVYRPSEDGSEVQLQEFEIRRAQWAGARSKPAFQSWPERALAIPAVRRPAPRETVAESGPMVAPMAAD